MKLKFKHCVLAGFITTIPMFAMADDAPEAPKQNPPKKMKAEEVPLPPLPGFVSTIKENSLSPDEIGKLKSLLDEQQKAQAAAANSNPAIPHVGMIDINLSPGGTPPVVRISDGQGSVLSFIDAEGHPWPVTGVDSFAKKMFETQIPVKEGNMVALSPLRSFGVGNVAIFLKDLPMPITITVLSGQRVVDYRTDFRIPKLVGNLDVSARVTERAIDPVMIAVLDGTVSDADAKQIKVEPENIGVTAWERETPRGNTILLRTRGLLASPAPLNGRQASSGDGTHAYEFPIAPVATILLDGKPVNLTLEIE